MEEDWSFKMKRFIFYFLEILILFTIQSSMFQFAELAGVIPNLMIILVVSTAYMEGRTSGLLIGFFSGLLSDIMFGSVIGLYALIYMVIGYLVGYANKIYSNDDFTLPIIFTGLATFLYRFIYYVFEFLLRGKLNFLYYFRRFIVPEIIYTLVISVFIYKFLHMINNWLNHMDNKEA